MLERQSAYDRLTSAASGIKTMMSMEPRNERHPSFDLQPLLMKRYKELDEARAFNTWLGERRRHLDDVSRLTEAVHRQVPQQRYARAERRGVQQAADEIAAQ